MKNCYVFILVFCFFQIKAQITFEKIYRKTNSTEHLNAVCLSFDGNYMLAGFSYDGITEIPFLIKADLLGNIIWRKIYPGLNGFYKIILTNDGGFALSGYIDTLAIRDMALIKTDSVGDVQWCKLFNKSNNSKDFALGLMQDQLGDIYMTGEGYENLGPNYMYILKVDGFGNLIWDKVISSTSTTGYVYAGDIHSTADGGVIITGSYPQNSTSGFFLMKIDSLGQTSWTKCYGNGNYFLGRSSCQTSDGGFISSGNGSSPNIPIGRVLLKSDSLGNLQWCKVYSYGIGDMNLIINSDGDYIMAGTHGDGVIDSANICLIKTNPQGDTIWTRFYEIDPLQYYGETGKGILQTSDGGYFVGGLADNKITNYQEIYTLKTDANGLATCNQVFRQVLIEALTLPFDTNVTSTSGMISNTILIASVTSQIVDSTLCLTDFLNEVELQLPLEVYPNPADEFITIKTPISSAGELILEIVDLMGRKILHQRITPGATETIDVSSFSKGVYILRISGKNEMGVRYFCKQ